MKKLSIVITALVMFASVAMAGHTITVDFRAASVSTDIIDTVVGGQHHNGCWIHIYSLDNAQYSFHFFFEEIEDIEDDSTYTLDDMYEELSYGIDYDLFDYADFTSVELRRSDGVYYATISSYGRYYPSHFRTYILNQVVPITSGFKDTVHITSTDRTLGRLKNYDETFIDLQCADDDYYMFLRVFETSTVCTFSESNVYMACLGESADNPEIYLNHLLEDVTISENDGVYTANIKWVGTDSVLYIIDYSYSDPVALTHETVSGVLRAYEQWGYYCFAIDGADYTVEILFYCSSKAEIYGAWNIENQDFGYVTVTDNTTGVEYVGFSGTLDIAENSITGTILAYGDIEFTINGTETAVENAETPECKAYTEGRTIVLNGAEGQSVSLYDITGRLISNSIVSSDNARFDVAASGVYLLRVNGQTHRVVVR